MNHQVELSLLEGFKTESLFCGSFNKRIVIVTVITNDKAVSIFKTIDVKTEKYSHHKLLSEAVGVYNKL